MTAVLIGSRAVKHWYPEFGRGPESDWDYLANRPTEPPFPNEGYDTDTFWDARIGAWPFYRVATPHELLTIKISHSFWIVKNEVNWMKHAADIRFLQRQGAQFLPELYAILRPIWKERHGGKEVSLNKSKAEFFGDNVVRKYDHDSLHLTVAHYDRPLYERVLRPGAEVDCDWEQFEALEYHDQIKMIREEIWVTALERILIPNDYAGSPGRAYLWALRRCATSLLKGKWQLFLMLNLDELMVPGEYLKTHLSRRDRLILNQETT